MEQTGDKIKNSFFDVLNYHNFKYMWLSQVFSQTALNMLTFALVLHLFDLTGKATSVSLVMLVSAAAVAIFGPISGVLADKINFRKILIYTNIFRFLAAILMILANGNVLAYLEIIFLISALSQIFTPAESSSVPLVVPQEKLISANSLIMTTTYITLLIGYSIAGPLLSLFGAKWLFFLCAIFYLAATWATREMSNFDSKEHKKFTFENMAHGLDRVWEELVFGFSYLRENKKILDPMIKLTVGWTVLGAFITLIPAYGESVMNINPKFIGPMIIAPAGFGMLLAALYLSKGKKDSHTGSINKGFLLVAISLLIFSSYYFYRQVFLAQIFVMLLLVVMGFGSSLVQVSAQTLLHLNSDEDKRGRVFGLSSMQLRLATSFPALIVGGVSDLTSPLVTMVLLAITVFIYSLILFFE